MKLNLDDAIKLTSEKTHSSSVYMKKIDGKKNVIKVYSKEMFPQALKEIIILKMIDHNNIIKINDIYEDKKQLHIIIPYIKDKIENCNKNDIFKSVLKAVAYLHHNNIIYGDIKIENIVTNKNTYLIDFGSSYKFFCKSEKKVSIVGTIDNQPPEIRNDMPIIYDEKIDIWTCGTLLFELFEEYYLYDDRYDNLRLDYLQKSNIDEKIKNAIIYMTVDYPNNRMPIVNVIKYLYDEDYKPETIKLPEPNNYELDKDKKTLILDKCLKCNFSLSTTLTSLCLCSNYKCDPLMAIMISSCLFENSPFISFKACKIRDIVDFLKSVDYKIYHNINVPETYAEKADLIKSMFEDKYLELARN